jgi:hypothetical protein
VEPSGAQPSPPPPRWLSRFGLVMVVLVVLVAKVGFGATGWESYAAAMAVVGVTLVIFVRLSPAHQRDRR